MRGSSLVGCETVLLSWAVRSFLSGRVCLVGVGIHRKIAFGKLNYKESAQAHLKVGLLQTADLGRFRPLLTEEHQRGQHRIEKARKGRAGAPRGLHQPRNGEGRRLPISANKWRNGEDSRVKRGLHPASKEGRTSSLRTTAAATA